MTMIELVAALALFVVILGLLLTVMDTATSLWSSSRSQQREQAVAQNLIDLLTDDLQQAVTDSGVPSNTLTVAKPTFILDSTIGPSGGNVQIVLQFARYATPNARLNATAGIPLSLDAVFYTFVNNALFRHVIPLSYTTFAEAKPLGDLLDEQRAKVDKPDLHAKILESLKDPAKPPPDADWSYTLLAERIDLLGMLAALPETFARKPRSHQFFSSSTQPQASAELPRPPEYDCLETDVLPDHVDIDIRLHNEEDWNTLQLLSKQSTADAMRKMQFLGVHVSKRITFPAQGGSRLP